MIDAYRIFKTRRSGGWFDGEGAYRYGGRWNSRGTRILYASESLSLAFLEILVHLEDNEITAAYSSANLSFEARLATNVDDLGKLPSDWSDSPIPLAVQAIGDEWVRSKVSVVLRVPSAIVRGEFNYLVNIGHEGFDEVVLAKPERFIFDNRLSLKRKM